MFLGAEILSHIRGTAVFWREVLSAHNRKFQGCSSFQLLTKRLWPRAVPWARIKILSDEIVSANRLAYPSGRRDQSKDPREKEDYEETKLGDNEEREMSSVERSSVRSEFENPLFSKKKIERRNASARLDRNAPSTVRYVIGIPFGGERPQISRCCDVTEDMSRLIRRFHSCHREDRTKYRKTYVYVYMFHAEVQKFSNEIKPNRV